MPVSDRSKKRTAKAKRLAKVAREKISKAEERASNIIDLVPIVVVDAGQRRGGGQPSAYRPEYCDVVVALGREGKSKAQIAARLDVTRVTLDNWADEHPEFFAAIKRALDFSLAWWEDSGQSGMRERGFNAAVWSRSMAARFPADYREERNTNVNFKDNTPRDVKQLSDGELEAIADEGGARAPGEGGGEARAGEAPGGAAEPPQVH